MRKRELTWQAGTGNRKGRWKKFYKGRAHYFAFGTAKSDNDGYKLALAAWDAKKLELDAEAAAAPKPFEDEYRTILGEWEQVLRWSLDHTDAQMVVVARKKLAELKLRLTQPDPDPPADNDRLWSRFQTPTIELPESVVRMFGSKPPDPNKRTTVVPSQAAIDSMDGSRQRIQREIWKDRLASVAKSAPDAGRSIDEQIESFLRPKRARVEAGELSAGRFTPDKLHVEAFAEWLGRRADVSSITSKTLADFHADLLLKIDTEGLSQSERRRAGKLSNDYARDRLREVKRFVSWLYETEVIAELPRVLTNPRALTINRQINEPESFTLDEVKRLLGEATERTRLYLLLMLNCGMYQKDIADLTSSEVDWKVGRIRRRRSKTQKHERAPTVNYQLWKETLELLQQERCVGADRVLLTTTGQPLKTERLDEHGKLKKTDAIANAFKRLRAKVDVKKSLKVFRKTSATLLRSDDRFSDEVDLFLGNVPSGIAKRHYAGTPVERLDRAVAWLGQQYGIS